MFLLWKTGDSFPANGTVQFFNKHRNEYETYEIFSGKDRFVSFPTGKAEGIPILPKIFHCEGPLNPFYFFTERAGLYVHVESARALLCKC